MKWRWPAKVVIVCHTILVGLSIVILICGLALMVYGILFFRERGIPVMGVLLIVTTCAIVVALCYELRISIVLVDYIGKEVDRERTLQKCRTWLVTCITLLIALSGPCLFVSVKKGITEMTVMVILNGVIRVVFIFVVSLHMKELRSGASRDNMQFSELEV